ncbi:MAG: DUF4270 domain-containing protein [Flavobacteriales bacterium]|nr:DUF4270 domain-containing protein [Flavobacteriales bacterium]
MNKITSKILLRKVLFLSAIFFLTFTFSCKKDGKLTPDFENDNLSINFTDTFSIVTTLIQEDSLRTDLSNNNLLGLYNDSLLGPVSSSIYTQLRLTGINVDFSNTVADPALLDSVVLTLDYQGLYGDATAPMTVEIYKLSSPLDANTDYYSNSFSPHELIPIATTTFVPNVNSDLRIKLDDSFGDSLIFYSPYTNNSAFVSFFNGLYITVKDSVTGTTIPQGSGSIAYFDLNSANSAVSLYYHHNELGKGSTKYNFLISSEGVKFSHFEHNYTGTDVEAHINNLPTKDTTIIYVSTMAGVKTKIEIPNIKNLIENGSVVINKAELIFTLESGTENNFADGLSTLSLVGIDANGSAQFLPDFFEGTEHSGGILVDQGLSKTYTFNISRHVHQLVYNTTTDYGMYLIANGSTTKANRSIIGSENSPTYKIRLEITYSKL